MAAVIDNNPLVSVVLTSYNQPELLQRAYNSLLHQTYKNIEIIIVDDYSMNAGNKILIESFKQTQHRKVSAFYQDRNVGIPANKNTGFRLARGEFITYLDGDDTYYENKIQSEIDTFLNYPDVDVVYSNFDIKNKYGDFLSVWAGTKKPAEGYIFKDVILNKFPDCHTHRYEMFKRHVLYDLGFYDEGLSVYHDLDFMIRYSLKYKVAYTNNTGSSYYKNPESIVSKTKGVELIEQQQKAYSKYIDAIKEYGLNKEFRKHLNELNTNKLYYLDKPDYNQIFRAYLRQPFKILKFAKLINFLFKKNKGFVHN